MALCIALLLCGAVVAAAAASTLIAASSARTQTTVAEQRYFAPTPASTHSTQDPAPDPPRPVDDSTSMLKPTVDHRSLPPLAAGTSTATASPQQRIHPSTPRPVLTSPSIPTSIKLADSPNPIPVVPIGVSAAGVLEPPPDISTAGWWASGPRPGTPGRTVITGHIDSTAGLGAFAALDLLRNGDTIALNEANGRILHFRVSARQEIEKTQLDPLLLQRTTNVSDLLLVTCIGSFNYSTRSYDSNLLITAVPVPQ